MNWLKLAYAAAGLALDEWRAARKRQAAIRAHTNNPRSSVLLVCDECGAKVRADLASMAEHRCP